MITSGLTYRDGMITIPIDRKLESEYFNLDKNRRYNVDIKLHYERRTTDANAYMRNLLNKLAIKLETTADELYQDFIKKVGVRVIMMVTKEAFEEASRRHISQSKYGGNQVNVLNETERAYVAEFIYGSSSYDGKEFWRLLEEIKLECKEQGIETRTDQEIKAMIKQTLGE